MCFHLLLFFVFYSIFALVFNIFHQFILSFCRFSFFLSNFFLSFSLFSFVPQSLNSSIYRYSVFLRILYLCFAVSGYAPPPTTTHLSINFGKKVDIQARTKKNWEKNRNKKQKCRKTEDTPEQGTQFNSTTLVCISMENCRCNKSQIETKRQ